MRATPSLLRLFVALALLCCGGAAVRFNQSDSPPVPIGAATFAAQLAASAVVGVADFPPAIAAADVPYVYAVGSGGAAPSNGDLLLRYVTDAAGNRIPDFSHAGYGGGGVPLPFDLAGPIFPLDLGSNASALQALYNEVAAQPLNATTGYRGVIQLAAGTYDFRDAVINVPLSSGIILRGAGSSPNGTVLLVGDQTFFMNGYRGPGATGAFVPLAQAVRTGDRRLFLANTTGFVVGGNVIVQLVVDAAWLALVQANDAQLIGTTYSVVRTVTSVSASWLEVEAPIYYNILNGSVAPASDYVIRNMGWTRFRAIRPDGNPNVGVLLEAHGSQVDVWMRDVVTEYVGTLFQGSGALSRRYTFEDCVSLFAPYPYAPDIRQMFRVYELSQLFVHRCASSYGRAFFGVQSVFKGSAIVLSHCTDLRTWARNYIFGAWYPGQLIEQHYSENGLDFGATGYGSRTAVASLVWNALAMTDAPALGWLHCASPNASGAMENLCVGVTSAAPQDWNNTTVLPSSLYIQQLKERLAPATACDTLAKLFYPAELAGTYQHPTALSSTQWVMSNHNTFETNRTDWNTTAASTFYRGDPSSGSAAACSPSSGSTASSSSTSSRSHSSDHKALRIGLGVGISLGVLLLVAAIAAGVLLYRRRAQ